MGSLNSCCAQDSRPHRKKRPLELENDDSPDFNERDDLHQEQGFFPIIVNKRHEIKNTQAKKPQSTSPQQIQEKPTTQLEQMNPPEQVINKPLQIEEKENNDAFIPQISNSAKMGNSNYENINNYNVNLKNDKQQIIEIRYVKKEPKVYLIQEQDNNMLRYSQTQFNNNNDNEKYEIFQNYVEYLDTHKREGKDFLISSRDMCENINLQIDFKQNEIRRQRPQLVKETYEDGSIYEGQKFNGKRHGRGKFYYSQGGLYDGEWTEDKMCGLGKLYYPGGGLAYEGNLFNNKFFGEGTVYNEHQIQSVYEFDYRNFDKLGENWIKYVGHFRNDFKDGLGTLYLNNGEKFVGRFSFDYVHGKGSFHKKNGGIIMGEWSVNKLVAEYA